MQIRSVVIGEQVEEDFGADGPCLQWIPHFARQLLTCVRKRTRSQDAWEREAGRKWRRPLLQFGEKVMLREAVEAWRRSHQARFGAVHESLPFLWPSCAELFGDGMELVLARGVDRLPLDQR